MANNLRAIVKPCRGATEDKMAYGDGQRVIDGQKPCSRCGVVREVGGFPSDRRVRSGRSSWCHHCYAENTRRWREVHPYQLRKKPQEYRFRPDGIVEIMLPDGQVTLIDAADYPLVCGYRWSTAGGYARTKSNRGRLLLHRLLLNPADGALTDHINCNPLDNRRCNLRLCDAYGNTRNQRKLSTVCTSRFKGVSRRAVDKRWRNSWRVDITVARRRLYLGMHPTEEAAARVYDAAAVKYFGEFAWLNFADNPRSLAARQEVSP